MDSRCKQVSRLGFILPARLPAFAVTFLSFVPVFTVEAAAGDFHPTSLAGSIMYSLY